MHTYQTNTGACLHLWSGYMYNTLSDNTLLQSRLSWNLQRWWHGKFRRRKDLVELSCLDCRFRWTRSMDLDKIGLEKHCHRDFFHRKLQEHTLLCPIMPIDSRKNTMILDSPPCSRVRGRSTRYLERNHNNRLFDRCVVETVLFSPHNRTRRSSFEEFMCSH